MPSQRKRIGFLPPADVQKIIDQICKHNKLSQSKVTGILVEEALNYRGVLDNHQNNKTNKINSNNNKLLLIPKNSFNYEGGKDDDNLSLDDSSIKEEIQLINDFIEFKLFKKIMKKNKKLFNS